MSVYSVVLYVFLNISGYTVHLVRTGPCATGSIPLAQPGEKRVVLTFDGADQDKVTSVREGVRKEDQWSQHANMQYRGQ